MQGKLDTEAFLASKGVNYTSIRPVYIYGGFPVPNSCWADLPAWSALQQSWMDATVQGR